MPETQLAYYIEMLVGKVFLVLKETEEETYLIERSLQIDQL